MLELKNIIKDYTSGNNTPTVRALKGVSLTFRKSEFVAVLGPSGCGKTTMLNIVGGLDQYTAGDLVINGRTTKSFTQTDWDAYRNNYVGFVFQSYNLISHQTVLGNVELALTLTGISAAERRERAAAALEKVGLKDQLHKRPNQLSGGQMQRVAIARAIVNNPAIILADEPTGALDSKTSVQVMDILKEISKDRLIIMVTHNDEIAAKYSTRVVKLLDGEILNDSNPFNPTEDEKKALLAADGIDMSFLAEPLKKEELEIKKGASQEEIDRIKQLRISEKQRLKERKKSLQKTSMSMTTALSLSGKNLLTKKGRTFMISLAGSIGIIGIALVLAIMNGFTGYIDRMQADMLTSVPLQISQQYLDIEALLSSGAQNSNIPEYPDEDYIDVYTPPQRMPYHFNYIDQKFVEHIDAYTGSYIDIIKNYSVEPNLVRLEGDTLHKIDTSLTDGSARWQAMIKNDEFMRQQYEVLSGDLPVYVEGAEYQQVALVVDGSNRITNSVLRNLGITKADERYEYSDFIGTEYVLLHNDNYYYYNDVTGTYDALGDAELKTAYQNPTSKDIKIKISGILRVSEEAAMSIYSEGFVYPQGLTDKIMSLNADSQLVAAQKVENTKGFGGRVLTQNASNAGKSFAYIVANSSAGAAISAAVGGPAMAEMMLENNYEAFKTALQNLPAEMLEVMGVTAQDMIDMLDILLYQEQAKAAGVCAAAELPVSITIYPTDFESKDAFNAYIDEFNADKGDLFKIRVSDTLSIIGSTLTDMVNIISYVLIAFAAISLVVSSIMISIITYVSVIERTKEIGVLRSIGARKKDITRVFNAETIIIGLIAGLLGVGVSYLLSIPINIIINFVAAQSSGGASIAVSNIASLNPLHALALVGISVVLTLVSGLVPAFMAAKKDPVVALRTE